MNYITIAWVVVGALLLTASSLCAQTASTVPARWAIDNDGGIVWNISPGKAHKDRIEMSGEQVSVNVTLQC